MQTTVREQGAQGYNNVVETLESLRGALAGRQQVRSGARRGAHRALHDSALRLDCAGRFSALKSCCTGRGRSGPAEAASDPAFSAADAYLASAGARRRRRPFAATRSLRAHAARICRARIYRAPRSFSQRFRESNFDFFQFAALQNLQRDEQLYSLGPFILVLRQ